MNRLTRRSHTSSLRLLVAGTMIVSIAVLILVAHKPEAAKKWGDWPAQPSR